MDHRLDHPLFERVRELQLLAGTWVIFGSGPMIARGIIPLENDLDIICLPETWDRARRFGKLSFLETEGVYIISIEDGTITLGTGRGVRRCRRPRSHIPGEHDRRPPVRPARHRGDLEEHRLSPQ